MIDAAVTGGVRHIAYTSVLGASYVTNPVAVEHVQTKVYLAGRGVEHAAQHVEVQMLIAQCPRKGAAPWSAPRGRADGRARRAPAGPRTGGLHQQRRRSDGQVHVIGHDLPGRISQPRSLAICYCQQLAAAGRYAVPRTRRATKPLT